MYADWHDSQEHICPTCGGEGVICVETAYYDAEFGQWLPDYREYPCPDCNGDWVDECDYAIEESVLGV